MQQNNKGNRPPPALIPTQIENRMIPVWRDVVAIDYMTVRSAPNPTADVLIILTRGHAYSVEASGKPWLKIKHPKLGDRIGYVSSSILNDQPVLK
jgi:hypothetical protein